MTLQEMFREQERVNQSIRDTILSTDLLPGEEQRISAIINYGGEHLKNFKPENRTYYVCLTAVMKNGMAIEYVPEKYRSKEMYAAACKSNGLALSYVPEKFITAAMCKDAVSNDGRALHYVPEKHKTLSLCKNALSLKCTYMCGLLLVALNLKKLLLLKVQSCVLLKQVPSDSAA